VRVLVLLPQGQAEAVREAGMKRAAKLGGARVVTQQPTAVYLPPLELKGPFFDPNGASVKQGDPVILRPHDPRLREVLGKVVSITERPHGRGPAFHVREYSSQGTYSGDAAHVFFDWDGMEHEQKAKKREEEQA
jgi:hypothetical protein